MGYKRSKNVQKMHTTIVSIDGLTDKKDVSFYLGKRIAYIYKNSRGEFKVMWGKVTRSHGNSGAVRAKWKKNLPARAIGARLRVMLYPSNI
eukprot:TRINITY_DN20099_c0_g1_i1.p2 TRINITY_DN20099_c0_g1~~TRINITY_DN20099_c0_g1_i1.p2  ORF type:complete len:103 (-),score=16.19 TRINITY_DN20099_c0_g1_i1:284-556(-)